MEMCVPRSERKYPFLFFVDSTEKMIFSQRQSISPSVRKRDIEKENFFSLSVFHSFVEMSVNLERQDSQHCPRKRTHTHTHTHWQEKKASVFRLSLSLSLPVQCRYHHFLPLKVCQSPGVIFSSQSPLWMTGSLHCPIDKKRPLSVLYGTVCL